MTRPDELLPCPYCGKSVARTVAASELWADEDDDRGPYEHSEAWSIICCAEQPNGPGGCGGQGGFKPSPEEAVAAWNRRAALPATVALPPLHDRIYNLAAWLDSMVSMEQESFDAPPDFSSKFDHELSDAARTLFDIAREVLDHSTDRAAIEAASRGTGE